MDLVPLLLAVPVAGLGALLAGRAAPVTLAWPGDHAPAMTLRIRSLLAARPGRMRRLLGGALTGAIVLGGAALAYAAQPGAPELLPGETIGVVGSGDHLGLQVRGEQGVRTLSPGDDYRDGWTLKAVTPTAATLTRGEETRLVGLNLTGAVGRTAQSLAPSEVNVVGGTLQAAIDAGDVARIMQLKGSPIDVIAAQKAILAKDPDAILTPARIIPMGSSTINAAAVPLSRWMTTIDQDLAAGHQPIFINDNGRTVMAFPNDQGRLDSFTTVPGMNQPGAEPVGIPYAVPAPDTSALERLLAQNQAMQAARQAALAANGGQPPAPSSAEQLAAQKQALETFSQANAARLGITPPSLPGP
ncbi:MAG: hypothetical protein JWM33_2751 [Caulobacteraceae bacterium]|nr:hypothetical protein [Caulobacteraceae bacterium]